MGFKNRRIQYIYRTACVLASARTEARRLRFGVFRARLGEQLKHLHVICRVSNDFLMHV